MRSVRLITLLFCIFIVKANAQQSKSNKKTAANIDHRKGNIFYSPKQILEVTDVASINLLKGDIDTNYILKESSAGTFTFYKKANHPTVQNIFLEKLLLRAELNFGNPELYLQQFYQLLDTSFNPDAFFEGNDGKAMLYALNAAVLGANIKPGSKTLGKMNDYNLQLYKTNPVKDSIVTMYNRDLENCKIITAKNIPKYVRDWRSIDSLYLKYQSFRDSLKIKIASGHLVTPYTLSLDSNLKRSFDELHKDNMVIHILRSDLNKNWFWLNGGIPSVNILNHSNGIFQYPNSALFPEKNNAALKEIDSILQANSTEIKKIEIFQNKIKLSNTGQFLKKSVIHLNYDSLPLKANLDKLDKKSDTSIIINLHNVPQAKKISFELNEETLPADNSIVTGLEEGISMLSAILPLSNIVTAIANSLSSNNGNVGTENEFQEQGIIIADPIWTSPNEKIHVVAQIPSHGTIAKVLIDSQLYYLTSEWPTDKKNLINEVLFNKDIPLSQYAIDEFLRTYKDNHFPDYSKSVSLETEIKRLFQELYVRINSIQKSIIAHKEMINSTNNSFRFLTFLELMPNRDLPTAVVKESDTIPKYQTHVKELSVGELKKVTLKIFEAEPLDSNNLLYYHEIERYKWQLFDVSAGLAFNYLSKDYSNYYYENKTDLNSLKNSMPHFAGIAGLHIYPWKINRNSPRFFLNSKDCREWKQRMSFYIGVNFLKPLKHFHPGISIDLIPGIKWINGVHLVDQARYTIANNTIVDEAHSVGFKGCFTAICIDPGIFTKIFPIK